jgi:hypothetical protein
MRNYLVFAILIVVFTPLVLHSASADPWYPGKGLKQGDYFRYNVCWTDWHNCAHLEFDFWVKNQTSDGNSWNLEFVVMDGSIVQKGIMTIGIVTPDPIHSDPSISDYASVYKSTIAWLDSFATKDSPKDFNVPAWGRSASVGGQSVGPLNQEQVTVQAGTFNTWVIGWHKGIDNKIWVDQTLPFPVKAQVYVDVTQGTPPPDNSLELLEKGNSQTEPKFLQVTPTTIATVNANCQKLDMQNDAVHDSKTTDSGSMVIEYTYSPSNPQIDCPLELRVFFEKNFDQSQRYSNIHYDIFTVDNNGHQLSSVAQDKGRSDLFAPVGEDDITIPLKGIYPVTHLVIASLGSGPSEATPDPSLSGVVKIDVTTQRSVTTQVPVIPEFPPSSLVVMTIVVAIVILVTKFKPSFSNIKL